MDTATPRIAVCDVLNSEMDSIIRNLDSKYIEALCGNANGKFKERYF